MEEEKNSEVTNTDSEIESNLKLHPLQQASLFGMMVLVMISFSVANIQSVLWFSSEWLVSTVLPAVVTDATNSARADEGKSPLIRSATLGEAARLKAEDMAQNNYFAHWSPTGVSPWYWFNQVGYTYKHAGENLAVHFTDSSAVVDAWLQSPTHRENIMSGQYTEIGIGTAKGEYEGYDTVFVVQMFGTPAAQEAESFIEIVPVEAEVEISVEVEQFANPEVAGVTEDNQGTVDITEEGTVVYETFAATLASNVEEVISAPPLNTISSPSFFSKLLTSPRLILQIIYSILGLLIVGALIASMIIEWRRHHAIQIAYATAMLLFMIMLFQLHIVASGGTIIA